jgi:hypothetical protein
MLPQALLLMSLVSSGCFVQALDNQNAATTSTVSSTELSTDIETSFRTSTRTTLSRHSVLETDASTKTTGSSERHTKISTYSSVPTTAFTESLVTTSTVELIESTPPPVHISVTEPPVHVTVAPAKPKPTCCSYPSGAYPYIDSKVDTTCLDPLFVSLSPPPCKDVSRGQLWKCTMLSRNRIASKEIAYFTGSLWMTSQILRSSCLLIAHSPSPAYGERR